MNPRKFYAPNSRDALRKVREVLGPNAVVLSNRPVSNGVELVAVAENELAKMADDDTTATTVAEQAPFSPDDGQSAAFETVQNATTGSTRPSHRASVSEQLLGEITEMKHLLESQLALVTWGDLKRRDPDRVKLSRHLINCGFSPSLTRTLIEMMPQKVTFDTGLQWIRNVLNRNLSANESGTDFIDGGGVHALLGPTGCGKTTTVAKLAARYVLRHGTSRLALLTMDSYRIGAHEQLRVYGKVLNVPVYSVRDAADLEAKLNELSSKHMVLIDTVGMSQRDQYIGEHLRILRQSRIPIKALLLLNATSSPSVLDDVVTAYQNGLTIDGSILTKTDESTSLGPVLDILIRRQLHLLFLTNGQRVPEDLYQPNRQYLLHKGLKYDAENSPTSFDDEEIPLLMSTPEMNAQTNHRILTVE